LPLVAPLPYRTFYDPYLRRYVDEPIYRDSYYRDQIYRDSLLRDTLYRESLLRHSPVRATVSRFYDSAA